MLASYFIGVLHPGPFGFVVSAWIVDFIIAGFRNRFLNSPMKVVETYLGHGDALHVELLAKGHKQ